jgi:hypothetical protein
MKYGQVKPFVHSESRLLAHFTMHLAPSELGMKRRHIEF